MKRSIIDINYNRGRRDRECQLRTSMMTGKHLRQGRRTTNLSNTRRQRLMKRI